MNIVILQSNYLPWKGYFDLIHDADVFVFYDQVQYTKNDWRNRNRLYSKNGLHWLTIPIPKSATKLTIEEVALPDGNWPKKHWQSIQTTYGSAPHWADVQQLLQPVYADMHFETLSQLNRFLIERLAKALGCNTRFVDVADLDAQGDRITRLVDIVQKLDGNHYISGPAAKCYLDGNEHFFSDAGIKLSFKDYSGYPPYPQFGEPFEHGVSVIDLIAHVGLDRAPDYLWRWR